MAINYNEEEFGLQIPDTNRGIMDMAFKPGSPLDNQINKLHTLEQMGFPQPNLKNLKEMDMKQFKETGTPLSLPEDQYAMAISNYDQLFGPKTMTDAFGTTHTLGAVPKSDLYTGDLVAKTGQPLRNPFEDFQNEMVGPNPHDPSVYDRYGNIQMALEKDDKLSGAFDDEPSGLAGLIEGFKTKAKTGWDSVGNFAKGIMDNTLIGKVAAGFDATNPNAFNYDPHLQAQIDLAMAGEDVGGLGWTVDDIGRFTSGALTGQNRQSAFGTNNLSRQLHARLQSIKNRKIDQTKWSLNKQKELQAAIDKIEAARKKKAGYDLSGGWTSPSGRDHAGTGGIGSAASRRGGAPGTSKGEGGFKGAYGGRVGYANGGLASLFTRRG